MNRCQKIDEYLNGDLSDVERDFFEIHLPFCDACAAEVLAWKRMKSLLFTANVELSPAPMRLVEQTDRRLRRARTRRIVACCVGIAATVTLAIWLYSPVREPNGQARILPAQEPPQPAASVRVSFPDGNILAVQQPRESNNVTFLMVYPSQRDELARPNERNDR